MTTKRTITTEYLAETRQTVRSLCGIETQHLDMPQILKSIEAQFKLAKSEGNHLRAKLLGIVGRNLSHRVGQLT